MATQQPPTQPRGRQIEPGGRVQLDRRLPVEEGQVLGGEDEVGRDARAAHAPELAPVELEHVERAVEKRAAAVREARQVERRLVTIARAARQRRERGGEVGETLWSRTRPKVRARPLPAAALQEVLIAATGQADVSEAS